MKKFAVVAAAVAVALSLGAAAEAKEWKKVRIGTEGAYPPYNNVDASGNLVGFEIDLAKDLCARMNVECEFVKQDWDGMIPALQQGKFDAIMAGMSVKKERLEKIDFSKTYANDAPRFGAREGSDLINDYGLSAQLDLENMTAEEKAGLDRMVEALSGKTIGTQQATIQAQFLEKYLPEANIKLYDTMDAMVLDLGSGRLDAGLAGSGQFETFSEANPNSKLVAFGPGMRGDVFGPGVGVGLRKEDTELKAMFNKALEEAWADGVTEELAAKWWPNQKVAIPPRGDW